ncbi:MAG: beta/gamma crystallin-related protein [Nostoc sp. DedSLP03]|uniref:beta/gamma crystallin-related protein n=1 Tax=Nostoc sp. DedSLP03 TaxID=3075400 RepID=UPI002AD4336F|nr:MULTISPECIES: beta/gamma crystallin-related protein [unclassified Nostoc]MDZ7966694.1 beta/gamma crystallin-related protein [Nostoc sp. DedSLP03]MDZ8212479.1 beta/gamma crystallin-related protein [Nostoc sp. ChiSLP03a]
MTTNNLYAIDTVQDINEESAAAVQGGILVYTGSNFRGARRDVQATRNLRSVGLNNVISSIRNNTRKTWVFYTGFNNSGSRFSLRPGQTASRLGRFDNQISSLRSIG